MKNLLLASHFGGGIARQLPGIFGSLEGRKAVLIPTAGIANRVSLPTGLSMKKLAGLGVATRELEISSVSHREIMQAIHAADIVFVSGGNTFFLMQELKRSGADSLIAEHVAQGKLYIGVSAGAVVAGPDIEYIRLMDDHRKGARLHGDFTGMRLVDFSVVPHLRDVLFGRAASRILARNDTRLDLRALTNRQAITVRGAEIRTVASR
ncbi:Type 1 glutamine amidotransferase-like domain-containing protein [Bifidobacterium subtile]|uniref:Putative peptidase E n=1 Tax=Bifidobacterium subtile TaxID=77635 RepID=A0A087E7G2_9BIFI|nr:Type 1 glutamine amidotransferase-like domain-containing protein [Bifidobacterium subtile]KFJ03713.1 putative peptidase E [Bifidobacterium subtile]MCI1258482.1 Type 1 glutamine amidotransferase-like domain-containing protein [Bifidobacterium subtile]QOL36208.1 Type 1 glutamine amidotransferase-like domain-containing protein [Bifidobacterium subtile]